MSSSPKTPWHLWVIGIVGLLWSAMGAFDYLMTEMKSEAYMAKFTPEQLEYFYGFPAWMIALWAIAVWGGVAGSVLLLLKKKLAAPVYLVSFLCMAVTMIRNYVFTHGYAEAMGSAMGVVFSAIIFVVAALLYLYARAMGKRGVLA